MKKISIAMITYNHENYIKQALDSVLAQKGDFDYEIIIGNDASKDKTSDIINEYQKKYPKKIKFIDRKKNIGAVNNLLDVLSNCNGDYVALLEGDDYWTDPYKLQKQLTFLEENKEYFSAGHDVIVVDKNRNEVKGRTSLIKYKEVYNTPKENFKYNYFPTCSIMYRNNNVYNELKLILSDVSLVADYTIKTYLITRGKSKILKEKLGAYRYITNGNNSFSSMGLNGVVIGYNDVIKGLTNLLKLNTPYIKEIKKEIITKKVMLIPILFINKKFKGVSEYLIKIKKEEGTKKMVLYLMLVPIECIKYIINNIYLKLF